MCEQSKEVKELFKRLDEYIDSLSVQNQSVLIPTLHKAQTIFGYLPEEVQAHIAKRLNVPAAKVYGVVSFYSYFVTKPRGKYVINVCTGTACFVKGAGEIVAEFERALSIKSGETTEDMQYTLGALRCVGACGLAPVILVNDDVFGNCTTDDVNKILAKLQ